MILGYNLTLNTGAKSGQENLLPNFLVMINSSQGNATINSTGTVSYPVVVNKSGNYYIEAKAYNEDVRLKFNITAINPTITIYNLNTTVGVGFTLIGNLSNGGVGIAGKTVNFYLGGALVGSNITDTNGIAKYYYVPNTVGNFTTNATFTGDIDYTACNNSAILRVNPMVTTIKINNSTTTAGSGINLIANLTNGGIGIAGKTVNFYVVGAWIGSNTTNTNGITKYYYIPYIVGNHTTNATFAGDINYTSSQNSATLTVNRMMTIIVIDNKNTTVKKGITLIANLSNVDGAGKIIEFFVNGTCVGNNTTDANGIARFYYVPQEVGNFTCGATFAGDSNCTSCDASAMLLVNSMKTNIIIGDITGETGSIVKLNATLKDEDGNPIVNRTVKFYLKGILLALE